jgi:predicted DsbA family dithiol-disulfide isomerase
VGVRNLQEASRTSTIPIHIEWMPFYLNDSSTIPAAGIPLPQYIKAKYGEETFKRFPEMAAHLRKAGEKVGISFNDKRTIVGTDDAHRIMELANSKYSQEVGSKLMDELFKAYFHNADNVSDKVANSAPASSLVN